MEKSNTIPFGMDIFTNAFQTFDESQFFKMLEEKIRPKSYYQKNKGLKQTLLVLSYLFNIVSALTASYLIYWLTKWLTDTDALAWVIAALFLFFLEKLKRLSSNEFFQVWFFKKKIAAGWLGFSLFIFAISVAGTYFGAEQGTKDLAPVAPIVIQDSLLSSLYADKDTLEFQIKQARETRWRGTTTNSSQKTIVLLTDQKGKIQQRISEREQMKSSGNAIIEEVHKKEVALTAITLAWISVLMEVLFELCIGYIQYYYYRSYVEHQLFKQQEAESADTTSSILAMVQQLQQQVSTLQNQQGIEIAPNYIQNGKHVHNDTTSTIQRPIGFFTTQQQTATIPNLSSPSKSHVHPCTQPEKSVPNIWQDIYTIPHVVHERNGKSRVVRYTLAQVENRINDYTTRVGEAKAKNLDATVLENRLERLAYWKKLKETLVQQIETFKKNEKEVVL